MSQTTIVPPEDFIPTRYSLLSRLQDWDDQESWKEFFETYWGLIYAVALKSGLTDMEAQDVVQETIISVAKNIQKFKRDRQLGSFKGWLRNLTRWRIADQLRKRTRAEPRPKEELADEPEAMAMREDDETAAERSTWEEEWRTNLAKVALENVKRRIKEEHFQIFDLFVIKQWPAARVAEVLNISAGKVYLIKFRVAALVKMEFRRLEHSDLSFL